MDNKQQIVFDEVEKFLEDVGNEFSGDEELRLCQNGLIWLETLISIIKEKSLDNILSEMERLRKAKERSTDPADYIIRLCQAIVAESAGYNNRMAWKHLQINN